MTATLGRLFGRHYLLVGLTWAVAALLVFWVLRRVPVYESLQLLAGLGPAQIALLILVNGVVLLTFSGRWWVLLRSLGRPVSYLQLSAYRLAAFGVSYFTPGPLVGGEPLQLYLIHRRHRIAGGTAVASLALDKALELLANFLFLVLGLVFVLESGIFAVEVGRQALGMGLFLLALPLLYLIGLWSGARPLSRLLGQGTGASRSDPAWLAPWMVRIRFGVQQGEQQAGQFCRGHPRAVLQALAISGLSWLAMYGEYWLALHLLGISLTPAQAIIALTSARIAILMPLPGGLGALEASQVLALAALGFPPAAGLSLSLFIRVRDVVMGLAGLWIGWYLHRLIRRQLAV